METDFTSVLDDNYFCAFRDAWESLRSGGSVPFRSDVRLQDFARFAADLLIYELKDSSDLRCRLMGSRVSERVKLQSMDVNCMELVAPDMQDVALNWWGTLTSIPCAGLMQFSTAYIDGSNRLSRCLLLPVKHTDGSVMLMGLNRASSVFRVEEPREKVIVSVDCFQTKYIDIGFGLPAGQPERSDDKSMDPVILERLTWFD